MSQDIIPIQSVQIKGVLTLQNVLASLGYQTLNQVAAADDLTLMKIRGMGPSTLARFKEAAKFYGIPWTGKPHKSIPLGPVIKLGHDAGSMNLRDWFAGQALIPIVTNYKQRGQELTWLNVAEEAYDFADALLHQREISRPYFTKEQP
jgi:hypothetical protein